MGVDNAPKYTPKITANADESGLFLAITQSNVIAIISNISKKIPANTFIVFISLFVLKLCRTLSRARSPSRPNQKS